VPKSLISLDFLHSALNDLVRLEDENPSIGIIICKEKNRTTVEYALKDTNKPIGISTYKLSDELPLELEAYLPGSEEIAKRLEIFEIEEMSDEK